jgi:hypothetical protein
VRGGANGIGADAGEAGRDRREHGIAREHGGAWAAVGGGVSERTDDMRSKLDGKFHGIIAKNKDGSIVPQDEWIVFLAKDNALLPTLDFYYEKCEALGASPDQLAAIARLIDGVRRWREAHQPACKIPDVEPDEIVG